jgi:hypothetical protein
VSAESVETSGEDMLDKVPRTTTGYALLLMGTSGQIWAQSWITVVALYLEYEGLVGDTDCQFNYQSNGDPSDRVDSGFCIHFFFSNNPCASESTNAIVDNWRAYVPSKAGAPPDHLRTCEPYVRLHHHHIT